MSERDLTYLGFLVLSAHLLQHVYYSGPLPKLRDPSQSGEALAGMLGVLPILQVFLGSNAEELTLLVSPLYAGALSPVAPKSSSPSHKGMRWNMSSCP